MQVRCLHGTVERREGVASSDITILLGRQIEGRILKQPTAEMRSCIVFRKGRNNYVNSWQSICELGAWRRKMAPLCRLWLETCSNIQRGPQRSPARSYM